MIPPLASVTRRPESQPRLAAARPTVRTREPVEQSAEAPSRTWNTQYCQRYFYLTSIWRWTTPRRGAGVLAGRRTRGKKTVREHQDPVERCDTLCELLAPS